MAPSSPRSRSAASSRKREATEKPVDAEPAEAPFWKQKQLEELTPAEWESLCDGCGRCCLVKLEDEDTGKIYFTDIACRLFDAGSCRCADYSRRSRRVRDCITLTPAAVRSLPWLPPSCAYRLVAEGRDLAWWHPLISGSPSTVHEAGISVRGRVAAMESEIELNDYPAHIVTWPGKSPRPRKPATRLKRAASPDGKRRKPAGE